MVKISSIVQGESLAILRAQTSPTRHHQQSYFRKRERTDMGSEEASRHGKQLSSKLHWGGGGGSRKQRIRRRIRW